MKSNPILTKSHPTHSLCLYKCVYSSWYSFFILGLLVGSFLLQPFHYVEANEEGGVVVETELAAQASDEVLDDIPTVSIPVPPATPESDLVPPQHTSTVSDTSYDAPTTSQEVLTGDTSHLSDGPFEDSVVSSTSAASSSEEDMATTSAALDVEIVPPLSDDVSTSSLDVPTDSSSSTDGIGPTVAPAPSLASTTVEDITDLSLDSALTATSGTTTVDLSGESMPLIHEQSGGDLSFTRSDCVQVADGSYYCQTNAPQAGVRDALISEPDDEGDLEIFLIKNGEYYQITDNQVDDAAPFYDGRSATMVWHRLVDERYQIMEYDFATGIEKAVTEGTYNDMEPTRFGDRTVWQRWVDDYWQVILLDDGEESQLTTGTSHHIAPHIRGEFVLWQTTGGEGERLVETLDLLTGTITTIADGEEASMANPRMMMVYEAVYDNGDIVTRGIDLKTGKIVALGTLPAELPEQIPDTDSTGETRALIQSKPASKDVEVDNDGSPEPVSTGSGEDNASSSTGLTLDLRTEAAATSSPVEQLEITNFDLVIPSTSSTQVLVE